MSKRNSENLRIKRKYLLWLADALGLSEATIDKAARSIAAYESFLDGKDFRAFHAERARAFKRYLTRPRRGNTPPVDRNGQRHSQRRGGVLSLARGSDRLQVEDHPI